MRKILSYWVDAFTSEAFKGNPAVVCLLKENLSDQVLQNIATEMNVSQTAFLKKIKEGEYSLRWFSPEVEVMICAHATLASAKVLFSECGEKGTVKFHTKSGVMLAHQFDDVYDLNFPLLDLMPIEYPALLKELGIKRAKSIGQNGLKFCVELESYEELLALKPSLSGLIDLGIRAVSVTSPHPDPQFDFASRYFAPIVGINEDPVCGSSHLFLAPFWGKKLGKDKLVAFQASKRSGVLHLDVRPPRVHISGRAVTIFSGEIYA